MIAAIAAGIVFGAAGSVPGIDSKSVPRPVPLTRPEMKQYLEDMKVRKPRIPLPELTEEDQEKPGERGTGYESRLRYHNLPAGEGRGGAGGPGEARAGGPGGRGRDSDPDMTLDYKFKVQPFWIVSRTNNCEYCLGHQESKLLGAGMAEDEIAALDRDWAAFTSAEQSAFAFARKFTYEPHHLNDADIESLRINFTNAQILEMIQSMAGNNSINRWKEGTGVPQSRNGGGFGRRTEAGQAAATPSAFRSESYLTPTAERFRARITSVAPLAVDASTGEPRRSTVCNRPPLESRADVEQALAFAHHRKARLPVVDEAKAREVLPEDWKAGPLPQWARLLATFPTSAKGRISGIRSSDERGDLTQLLKAQVSWIIARQDRAWYATGLAKECLLGLGQTEDQIYQLDGGWSSFTPKECALFTVARRLAATPVVLTDDEVDEAVRLPGPRDVVQLISDTTRRASFDRITEAAGLPLEN
jgi:hypothetical protein